MSSPRQSRVTRLTNLAAVGLLVLGVAGAATTAPTTSQILMVVVNGVEAPEDIAVTRLADDRLVMTRRELSALGVPLPSAGGEDVPLDTLPGVTVSIDEQQQILKLNFAIHDKSRNRIALASAARQGPLTASSTGILFNYDVELGRDRYAVDAQGLFEARLFSRFGTLSTSVLANSRSIVGQRGAVRLDTSYTLTDVAHLRRYNAGDLISGGLQTSRSVRMAGFQITTDFSVRPDLITYPVPLLSGSAAVPSTVEILINGSRVGEGRVAAGDFAVSGAPIINGIGTVDVVVRDALGREARTSFNVYGVRTLLASGLSACTLDAGAVRRNYAIQSNDYRFVAGTATCRIGVNDSLTLEGHAEAAGDLALGGGGALLGLGRFGVLSLNASASTAATGRGNMSGGQIAIGFELVARPISFNFSAIKATKGYRDVAARAGDPPSRSSILALVAIDLQRLGSFSIGLTRGDTSAPLGQRAQAFQQRVGTPITSFNRATLISATYIVNVGHGITVYANGLRDFDRQRSTIAVVGATIALGSRASASATMTGDARSTYGDVQVYQPVTQPGDFGYRLLASSGAGSRLSGETRYQGSWGEFSAGVERVQSQVAARAGLRGSVVLADGGLLLGNTLDGSFAIVDSGLPDVAIIRDNRPAGRTNAQGRLLVPNLRPFEANRISIDPLSLPDDALPGVVDLSLTPRDRTGVTAKFAARLVRAARVRLIDASGVPLPPGARARLNDSTTEVPVGYDGEVYLTDLAAHNRISVTQGSALICTAAFDAVGPLPPIIGPVICRAAS